MPFSLLIALVLAFGFRLNGETGPLSRPETLRGLGEAVGLPVLVAVLSFILGRWLAWRVVRQGGPSGRLRRAHALFSRAVDLVALGGFAWLIHGADWPRVVEWGLGLRRSVLLDESLILAPFLIAQVLGWWGLYAAERALRIRRHGLAHAEGLGHHLLLRARQALGLVIPAALVYGLGRDLLLRYWPETANDPYLQLGWLVVLGALVLSLAPALVRLAWPTRRLEDGPLRERLERLAERPTVSLHRYPRLGYRRFAGQCRCDGCPAVVSLRAVDRRPD